MTSSTKPLSDTYRLKVKKPALLTLIVLISYAAIGAAILTPAIPDLMHYFDISANLAQLTLTIYLIGYAIGQLIYGPLAKRLGRKPALYVGIGVSLIGTVLCALSRPVDSFLLLIVSRFLSALGASAGLCLTFLIISDYFYEKQARKMAAYALLGFAVIPRLAIVIGGELVTYVGWESCFYFLLIYGFFTLYLIYRLAETGTCKEKDATKIKIIFKAYRSGLKCKVLVLYSIMIGLATATIYIFTAAAPVIVIEIMGTSPELFGWLSLIPASGYFCGNFVAARLSSYLKTKIVLRLGISLMGTGVLILAIVFFGGWGGPLSLFFPLFVVFFGIPIFYSNAAVLATSYSLDKASAASLMSFLNMGGVVMGLILIELLSINQLYEMPLVFILIMICMFFLFRKGEKLIED